MLATYKRTTTVPIVSHATARTYTFTVRDLPTEEKPREKLTARGPEILGLSELLAVILGVGTKKEEILSMTHRIVKEYGEKSIMSARDPKKLAADLDIPTGHAVQIIAAV